MAASSAVLIGAATILWTIPIAAAGSPGASRGIGAPFGFNPATVHVAKTLFGCATSPMATHASMNSSSGATVFAAFSSARNCNGTDNVGESVAYLYASLPMHLAGHHVQIVIFGNASSYLSANITPPTHCRGAPGLKSFQCYTTAGASISANATLDDMTNGSKWTTSRFSSLGEAFVSVDTICSARTCNTTASGSSGAGPSVLPFSLTINATGLVANHTYLLYYGLSFTVTAYVQGLSGATVIGGSASAKLDVASAGRGVTISSITIR